MTEQLEHDLRHLFHEDALHAPNPQLGTLAAEARRRARRTRQVRMTLSAGLLVAAAAAGVAMFSNASLVNSPTQQAVVAPVYRPTQTGALPDTGLAKCATSYSPEQVAEAGFAFEGTVVAITAGRTDRPGVELGLVGTTFEVRQWFVGGTAATITVDMPPPGSKTLPELSEAPPSYEIGTRLLVSGASRWGAGILVDGIAWGCGFTRYYDAQTAASWSDATS